MAEVVVAHGGEVAALTGDGLMAVFACSGQETGALACALAMQDTLAGPDGIAAGIGVATYYYGDVDYIRAERIKWEKIVKSAGIRLE